MCGCWQKKNDSGLKAASTRIACSSIHQKFMCKTTPSQIDGSTLRTCVVTTDLSLSHLSHLLLSKRLTHPNAGFCRNMDVLALFYFITLINILYYIPQNTNALLSPMCASATSNILQGSMGLDRSLTNLDSYNYNS
jgi:hypothetical protein